MVDTSIRMSREVRARLIILKQRMGARRVEDVITEALAMSKLEA